MKPLLKTLVLVFLTLSLITCALPANAAGSDAPIPYSVDSEGVTLPDGVFFPAHGHVNWRTTLGVGGVHFDPNNDQPGGAYIGKAFVPIPLTPGECIVWVQVSMYSGHFGEGGQEPICKPVIEEPTVPEPSPTDATPLPLEPSPPGESPEPSASPTATAEPKPSATPDPHPTPEPSPEVDNATDTSTAEAPAPASKPDSATSSHRTDSSSAEDTTVIAVREEPIPVGTTPVLADTGVTVRAVLASLMLLSVGVLVLCSRRWRRER